MIWIVNLTYLFSGFALGLMVCAIADARRAKRMLADITAQLAHVEAKADAAIKASGAYPPIGMKQW